MTTEEIWNEACEAMRSEIKNALIDSINSNSSILECDIPPCPFMPDLTTTEKAIKTIKNLRTKERYYFEQGNFCDEHGFELEKIMFRRLENEIRRVCNLISTEFETGWIFE